MQLNMSCTSSSSTRDALRCANWTADTRVESTFLPRKPSHNFYEGILDVAGDYTVLKTTAAAEIERDK
jgi:hypothetical protein